MRKITVLTFILAIVLTVITFRPPETAAQTAVDTLEIVTVEIWPDYDRPSVLVLITGTLPEGTALPATVNVPLSAGAELNAVARIAVDNQMYDDVEYMLGTNELTMVATEQRFRVEYYTPYTQEGDLHSFVYSWGGGTAVNQFGFTLQQPRAAENISTDPTAQTIIDASDGLRYYEFAPRTLAPGQGFTVEISYEMPNPQLTTAGGGDPLIAELEPAGSSGDSAGALQTADGSFDWPLLLIGLGLGLVIAAAAWLVISRQQAQQKTPRKPKPVRRTTPPRGPAPRKSAPRPSAGGKARFCPECGAQYASGDRFCRQCGAPARKL